MIKVKITDPQPLKAKSVVNVSLKNLLRVMIFMKWVNQLRKNILEREVVKRENQIKRKIYRI
jgi:hypothetical protein